jgi:putative oxidoreductase
MMVVAQGRALAARLSPAASLFLRLGVGLVFLNHGLMKLHMGVAGVGGFFHTLGIPLPSVAAVVVIAVETFGAACVVLGVLTRLWALAMAMEMAVAILVAVLPRGHNPELEALLLAGALALVALGDGPVAVGSLFKKKG